MGGNRVVTNVGGKVDFTVMNNVCGEASGKEDLGCRGMRRIIGCGHGGGGKVDGGRMNGRRDLPQ